ncbi:MAG TPA: 4-alpha-glucanotransferase [Pyrinomonadaceae bacterium]
MSFSRSSGILLHPTSLPGPYGIGDLGPEAYRFADFLVESRQSFWQVLPLGPTGYGDSPYASFSAFAGNTLLVSPERLVEDGLLAEEDLRDAHAFPEEKVDYEGAHKLKDSLLRKAFDNFRESRDEGFQEDFGHFHEFAAAWLDDYALYRALKDEQGGTIWTEWGPEIVRRDHTAMASARERLREEIEAQKFYQYLFFRQWMQLKRYCNGRGVRLIGDIPIFVAHDSADVWTNAELFKLNEAGAPLVVAGVPPDYFSATGQLWGNPIYNWERMIAEGFRWWVKRVHATLQLVDVLRIDHFRGFAACWEIPGGDRTAERGQWVAAPGRELFTAIRNALGELPIIAEDLGVITPDVVALRDAFGFPGMRILQFAFGGEVGHLPHNYRNNMVVYTGTHDNDTSLGWFNSRPGTGSTRTAGQIEREREYCLKYMNSDGAEVHWDFIRTLLASVADTTIVPLQDVLGLGNEARMNLPNTTSGNWVWRFKPGALTGEMGRRLKELTEIYGRADADETKKEGAESDEQPNATGG